MKYTFTKLSSDSMNGNVFIGFFNDAKELGFSDFSTDDQNIFASIRSSITDQYESASHFKANGGTVTLINCGNKQDYTEVQLSKIIKIIANTILKTNITCASISLPPIENQTPNWQAQEMILQFEAERYQFLEFKTLNKKSYLVESIKFDLDGISDDVINDANSIASGINLAKDLANTPANICTPEYMAKKAVEISEKYKSVSTQILDESKMQELGMGSLLAVGQGSSKPPRLVELKYQGNNESDPVVLIGKGITFDSGGISIKPSSGMEEMKFDMCGAASVLGTIKACALLKLPINVVGLLACAENMPGSNAIKPGDVVTSMSGQTIEITNTDAEGRLVLADALTYAKRFKPQLVVDIATLTGAVIVALGHERSGLMTNDDELADIISKAGENCQDTVWRLPLEDKCQQMLESPVADMVNSPAERIAGTIVAGSFLSKFSSDYRWAHLDIAGTAWKSGKNRSATGRPVPLLVQLLRNLSYAD
ncbi:MAG: leucyl aminopeptidase [Legionellaceae bacterium]|nr:leucyl aminopeptidase [Legionellaceae bacterium]